MGDAYVLERPLIMGSMSLLYTPTISVAWDWWDQAPNVDRMEIFAIRLNLES